MAKKSIEKKKPVQTTPQQKEEDGSINLKLNYTIDEIVVDFESFDKKYECNVCCNYILDTNIRVARQCPKGHYVCMECWERILKSKKECPHCRTKVESVPALSRNIFLENEFNELLVHCPFSKEGLVKNGLSFNITTSTNDNIKINKICDCKVKFKDLDNHLRNKCHRIIKCCCGAYFKKENHPDHIKQCPESKISCENCLKPISKSLYENHKTECSEFFIGQIKALQKCNFPDCNIELPMYQMGKHMESHVNSLYTMIKDLSIRIDENKLDHQKFPDEYSYQNEEKYLQIVKENKILREKIENNEMVGVWTIQDYRISNFITSKSFNMSDLRFKVKLG
ncbi:hypothetical protein DICPUDRAFT_149932 [Dictyostelium purpureum]|uniref:RING-type domain-containing protein n=1 Tax=Dictyostelium purpureum TaxID=5786 RepID=F0ZF14_DICPU|nr:uncharacterized protein DICPUDRAFT_149932 [Dictyostelium purpureum]EGC37441.1 hypothetical protein DICPUDRAFT_149932 [Dictyostelium purpureum]|eukprot:XP_003286005.1 hypothetical protein DICPUDRAFT_149932 [Dictyostelium purpureum]